MNFGIASGKGLSIGRSVSISAGLFLAGVGTGYGQDALRSSIAGERAAEAREFAARNQFYNLKLGPVQFTFKGGVFGGWNDNIRTSEDAESDFLVGPSLTAQGIWPVSPKNTVHFSIGAAYYKYIEHNDLDRFTIRPDSTLEFNIFVKDFRINLHDRMSYSLDPIDFGSVSGVSEYGGLDNTAGVSVDWDLNQVILTAGYDHYNFVSTTDASDQEARSAELFNLRAAIEVNDVLKLGPEFSAGFTDYRQMFHNDNQHFSAGVFADWKMSQFITIRPRAGYVHYAFDSGGAIGDTPDLGSYYANLGISHQMTDAFTHSLQAGHEVQSGINSDALTLYFARYQMDWKLMKNMGVYAATFYEHGSDSESTTALAEDYDRIGLAMGTGYQLTRNLNLELGYQFTLKDSNRATRDYRQNVVTLTLNYQFLPKLQ